MVDVFISYPRVDRAKVELIKRKLDEHGLDTFFDIHGIDGGDMFPDVIDHALKKAKAVLGVWSPRAFQSKWCMIECRVGATRGVLVPVALERFSELDMKSDFMTTNYLDLTDFDGSENHEGWSRTLRALSRHVGRELAPSAPSRSSTPPRPPTPAAPPKGAPLLVPEMVRIPPGRFLMGSPDTEVRRLDTEGPQHDVRIDHTFELGKYPVTLGEWDAARAAGAPLHNPSDKGWGRDARPVIDVSWSDAQKYLGFLNSTRVLNGQLDRFRLPSEAEWEYACRAGTSTPWTYSAVSQGRRYGWFEGNANRETHPVGEKLATVSGLHDVYGNVWEWCEDCWHHNYENGDGAPTDGSAWINGASSQRVLRGGSWRSNPNYVSSVVRVCNDPTARRDDIGFRVARTLT